MLASAYWGSQAYPLVDDGTVTCPAPTPYPGPDGNPLDPMSLIEPSLSFLDSSGLDAQCLGAIVGGLPICIQDIVIQDGCCSAGCAMALNTFLSVEDFYPGPPPPPPSPEETSEHSDEHSHEESDEHSH
ncbi:hypothetical protein QJQ45_009570 [Haematococcus lacustris]|nr:hypothetical protein QJQ45_009570 [Haematococcus lacustris]